jgi:hypothetical protein
MATDPRAQAYVARRTAEGKITTEITRCLKRYLVRPFRTELPGDARMGVSVTVLVAVFAASALVLVGRQS